ncbi:hypothetical protein OG216_08835 [Streptomycetaceae bacterium NBC_01309]
MTAAESQFPQHQLMRDAQHAVIHLELRDVYTVDADLDYPAWLEGWRPVPAEERWRGGFYGIIGQATERGVDVRRLRVVSEPVTDYIRYEYDLTFANVDIGEQVRWLPRRDAVGLLVPAVDFWAFDATTIMLTHWDGNGRADDPFRDISQDAELIKTYTGAFDTLWSRATPHEDYVPR